MAAPKKENAKNERYRRIAAEAAKQCGRGRVPEVEMPRPDFAAVCAEFAAYDLVLFFYEGRRAAAAAAAGGRNAAAHCDCDRQRGRVAPEEAAQAAAAGAVSVGLGPRILRCETAPLAALAAVLTADRGPGINIL